MIAIAQSSCGRRVVVALARMCPHTVTKSGVGQHLFLLLRLSNLSVLLSLRLAEKVK